ncbi:MAG: thioredoxin domain-containing protein [Candidatus Kerfeldbacteria bacterium]|nr:thioredoxin domain-containing protein [Candidatus Kerfeldbacteria bacterium]
MDVHAQNRGMFENVSPKLTFLFGIVTAIAMLSTVGFFLLLANGLEGEAKTTTKKTAAAPSNTNTNPKVAGDTAVDPSAPPAASTTVDLDGLRHVQGKGDITFVEFSDLECPFCKQFHPTVKQVLEKYDGKVRVAFKHFPLGSLHPKAQREAEATECASDQGKFWEYVDLIFERTPSNNGLADEELFTIADDLKLDRDEFDKCLEDGKYTDLVQADYAEAVSLGGQGTPYSVIVDKEGDVIQPVSGALPYSQVTAALDQALGK